MRKIRNSIGLVLIIIGGFLILQNLNIVTGEISNILWGILLGGIGVFFLTRYFARRTNWGWLIPGITLLGIGLANIVELIPGLGDSYSDFIILSSIGLSFVFIYFNDRLHWWALVPGGLLISLGISSLFEALAISPVNSESILFLGLGITFLILFLLPMPYGRLKWALLPAIVLIGLGTVVAIGENIEIGGFIGPAIILIFGVLVLVNTIRK